MNDVITKYQVVDTQTGAIVATYTSRSSGTIARARHSARRRADRLDLEYGAVRYSVVVPIESRLVNCRIAEAQ